METPAALAQSPLRHYIGSWQGEVSVESAGAAPQRYIQRNTFAWTLDGLFLEERGTGSNGSTFLGMWAPAPGHGLFRAHYFAAPSGDVVVLSHEWHEASRTFTGFADLGGGMRMLASDRFLDRDSYEWSITVQDASGTVLSKMYAREHRVAG